MKIKILDLFAGAGGLSSGFEMYVNEKNEKVFEVHRAVEIDPFACNTLRKKHGMETVIEGDLTDKKIHKKVIKECKGIDIVMGGIPCQSFSLIGPRSGKFKELEKFKCDTRDRLYEEFRDIVKELTPKIVVIENVKGILSKKDGNGEFIINHLINDFEKLGYNFENESGMKYFVLNAADYGVPQIRERVILVGVRKNWKDITIPNMIPTHYDPNSKSAKELKNLGLLPYVTVYDAIGDLPRLEAKLTSTGISKRGLPKIKSQNKNRDDGADILENDFIKFKEHYSKLETNGKNYFKFIGTEKIAKIHHHKCRSHKKDDIQLYAKMNPGETAGDFITRCPEDSSLIIYDMNSFKDKYRKQDFKKPSTTIFAHLEKDGNRFIHPEQPRTYTPREAARIQSFPDDYIFEGPFTKKFKQIGNAVPPRLSFEIATMVHEKIISEKNKYWSKKSLFTNLRKEKFIKKILEKKTPKFSLLIYRNKYDYNRKVHNSHKVLGKNFY
ncbi:DNA (cytosine-5)-methyltransferase 1 [Methanococcus maripaludis]|uniref:DNA (cytosine-5-)-methyltransferase n=1 Tax=Methanococcus maripaludis TaxID=39152 RepID=A0A7J9P5R5_METMI|nr:DNA cytosine methyltransferase [Methanococcus maripaludis]MBA2853476.1 DNA (cytosine-5)-methyltransferase 1 [Methanococcus maripaludis]